MKLDEFKTNRDSTFSGLKCKLNIAKPIVAVEGIVSAQGIDSFRFISGDAHYEFKFKDDSDARMILDRMRQNNYNLAHISPLKNGSIEFDLHIVFFYTSKVDKKTNVILSEKVKDTLIKKHLVSRRTEDFEESVRLNFVLSNGTSNCYTYTSGNYLFDDTLIATKEDEDKTAALEDSSDDANSEEENVSSTDDLVKDVSGKKMKIFGKDYSLSVCQKMVGDDVFLYAEKIDIVNANIPNLALNIGEISFKDGERYVSEKVRRELSDTSGYIDIWDQYTKLEGDFLLEKTRKVGAFSINRANSSRTEGGVYIMPIGLTEGSLSLISNSDNILFSENIPVYIQENSMTWIQFKEYFMAADSINIRRKSTVSKRVKRVDKNGYIIIELGEDEEIPEGIASLDIYGEMQQILRRETARDLIANAESANPALGRIFDGRVSSEFVDMHEVKKINPLSPFVKSKIFTHEPTSTQVKAIDIALNTPDIAIIQGPPGTGKTTVITAIIERLNEIADKRKDVKGQVLVTSFQHDAVRNVIERLSINSLPTIKFGTQGENDLSMEKAMERWCDDYKDRLIKRNPNVNATVEQKKLLRLRDMYIITPSRVNAINFLKYAQAICLDNDINEEINFLLDDLQVNEGTNNSDILTKIYRLRTSSVGFKDDGSMNADDLLEALESIINRKVKENEKIMTILERAADFSGEDIPEDLLQDMEYVKKLLIEKCKPRPTYSVDKAREDVLEVYGRVSQAMRNPQNEEDEILYNLLNELEGNITGIRESVVGYNFVFAATTQQSEGVAIKRAKEITDNDGHPTYDTIIIDEAARVNPGDLMVPMAQGKRRIILVGDHRQLPHIYNEEIFENMQSIDGSVGKDVVKISMFEYLMQKAKELYSQDKVERTITLDAQYRMHPLLGKFVSRQFYDRYDEGFKSPLSEDKFQQNLYNKPLVWIDLQNSIGNEEKYGTSRIRHCEADVIASKIKEFIESGKGTYDDGGQKKELKYGVITFYSAQVKEIQKKLGVYADRVRVGSVDAFQGMEFDVIFLSVVRSHKKAPDINYDLLNMDLDDVSKDSEIYSNWEKYIDKLGMSVYGFLTSENRLCVALSRQKKLLVVVGDSNIFVGKTWCDVADKCVPAMKALYELAKREGEVINGKA